MNPRLTFQKFLNPETKEEYMMEGLTYLKVKRQFTSMFDSKAVTATIAAAVGGLVLGLKFLVEKFKDFISSTRPDADAPPATPLPPAVVLPKSESPIESQTGMRVSKAIESPSYLQAPKNAADLIAEASKETGVTKALLLSFAQQESSFDPTATNKTTGAFGLFQMTSTSWKDMVRKYGSKYGFRESDRYNPRAAALMGAYYVRELRESVKRYLGSDPSVTDLYAAHVLGPTGVRRLFDAIKTHPNMPAEIILGKAADANPNLFFADGAKKQKPLTVKQVYAKLFSKVGAKYTQYENAEGTAASLRMPEFNPTFADTSQSVPSQTATTQTVAVTKTQARQDVYEAPKQDVIETGIPVAGDKVQQAVLVPAPPKKKETVAAYARSKSGVLLAFPA